MKTLGIDIGATSVKAFFFDGKTARSSFLLTPKNKKSFLIAIKNLIYENGGQALDKIGVGVPGQLDRKTGKIRNLPNLKYLNGFNFKRFVDSLKLNKKLVFAIDNDVRCALNAELKFGQAKNYKNAVFIAVGTGIGGAIAVDGKIDYGAGSAGEIGHMIIEHNKSFEQLAGGKTFKNFGVARLKKSAELLGLVCANMVNLLNPEIIILGGGVLARNPGMLKIVASQLGKFVIDPRAKKTKVVLTQFGELGGSLGAAWL